MAAAQAAENHGMSEAISQFALATTMWSQSQCLKGLMLVMYSTSKMSLQSPDFLSSFLFNCYPPPPGVLC